MLRFNPAKLDKAIHLKGTPREFHERVIRKLVICLGIVVRQQDDVYFD